MLKIFLARNVRSSKLPIGVGIRNNFDIIQNYTKILYFCFPTHTNEMLPDKKIDPQNKFGSIESLNVSVASGILLNEITKNNL